MKTRFPKYRQEHGSVLFTVIIIGAVMGIAIAATLSLSSNSLKSAHGRVDWNKAYYTTENAMVWATQSTLDAQPAAGSSNYFSTADGTLPVAMLVNGGTNGDLALKGAWVEVVQPAGGPKNSYIITASSRINDKVRTLQASITAYPVSKVFDYEYFLNNWGWWWGTPIYGQGAQRSNWDFDLKGNPTVNGYLYAADLIKENGNTYNPGNTAPFVGKAASDPIEYVHPGAPRVDMPNLLNFSNYIATATANTNSNGIWIGSTQVVAGVVNNGSKSGASGIYLVGTAANPIKVKGTVVVPGDVIIKGVVSGQGTLYVGGNLYIADNLTYTYNNGPNFGTYPETMSATNRDAWVASNQSKDLVAYAVNGSIFGGDVTSSDWKSYEYDNGGSALKNVGSEATLGQDGIEGTGDDGIPFLHPDGTMSAWYDADGDGVVNANYNYSTDINMTAARASAIQGYPTDNNGQLEAYSNIANGIKAGTFCGVFYTDHAVAICSVGTSVTAFYGAMISRNEQIYFNGKCSFIYDSRIHSRYHNNPNNIINLGLPFGKALAVNSMVELTPNATGL